MARALSAIVGLGMTTFTRQYTLPASSLAVEAVHAAIADAGLKPREVDGLLFNRSPVAPPDMLSMRLQEEAGLRDLRLLTHVDAEGSSAVQMIQYATMAVRSGMAKHVACVFADTPLVPGISAGAAFGITVPMGDLPGVEAHYGLYGAVAVYAMAARRHMARYGTTQDQLGQVAISNRSWAVMNPLALLRQPLTLEQYHASKWVVEPFHVLDCAMPVNGAIAFVVSGAEGAAGRPRAPVYIVGMGQGHAGSPIRRGFERETHTGARLAGETAYRMAGIGPRDIDACEFYDAFTYSNLVQIEDYGFCERGESGPFVAAGNTRPGGSLPMNTGGGHLSSYYLQGVTPISEAVMQVRGDAGERQLTRRRHVLVTGSGGRLDYHACLIVSPQDA